MADSSCCDQAWTDDDSVDPRAALTRLLPELSDEVSWEVLHLVRSLLPAPTTNAVRMLLLWGWVPTVLLA